MKPSDAIGEPVLIVFSDASQDAYAACAYVRWKRQNGQFESNLISSKNRLAPIKKLSIDRIELCGAVLNISSKYRTMWSSIEQTPQGLLRERM